MAKRKSIKKSNKLFTYNSHHYVWGGDSNGTEEINPFDLKGTFSESNISKILQNNLGNTIGTLNGNLISRGLNSKVGNTIGTIESTIGGTIGAVNPILGRPSNLKKKFRIWRANIPRANVAGSTKKGRDRMRNPWLYIKLSMEEENVNKTVLHDMIVHYFE